MEEQKPTHNTASLSLKRTGVAGTLVEINFSLEVIVYA